MNRIKSRNYFLNELHWKNFGLIDNSRVNLRNSNDYLKKKNQSEFLFEE